MMSILGYCDPNDHKVYYNYIVEATKVDYAILKQDDDVEARAMCTANYYIADMNDPNVSYDIKQENDTVLHVASNIQDFTRGAVMTQNQGYIENIYLYMYGWFAYDPDVKKFRKI